MKRFIPNLITLGNLLCGVVATMAAVRGHLDWAAFFIFGGIFLDFFDGLTARLLGVSSPLGKELDSLADEVTSGVAPGMILFALLEGYWFQYVALLIPLFSAYRLAKFNLDERQSHSFLGLPTPANALIWAAIGLCHAQPALLNTGLVALPWAGEVGSAVAIAYAVASLLLGIALVSELPLISLKFKHFVWSEVKHKVYFLLGCLLLLVAFGVMGIAFSIVFYVLFSLVAHD